MGLLSKFKKEKDTKETTTKETATKETKAAKEDPKGTAEKVEKKTTTTKSDGAATGAAAGGATGGATGAAAASSKKNGAASKGFLKDINTRRTVYTLNKEVPLSHKEIESLVQGVVDGTPSSFNSQPVRAIILFDDKHTELWDKIAVDALKKVVREENWEATGNKLKGFAAAAGTVLFFEDSDSISKMQEQFPSYAANFPIWAGHSSGATQIHLWTALALEDIGANLQHYSPLIDEGVNEAFKVPKNWVLTAQLVFGGLASPAPSAPEKQSDTVRVA